jgi:hypothetical protein
MRLCLARSVFAEAAARHGALADAREDLALRLLIVLQLEDSAMQLLRLAPQRAEPMGEIPELRAQGDLPEARSLTETTRPVSAIDREHSRPGRDRGEAPDASSADRDARRRAGQASYRRSARETALAAVLAR